MLTRLLDKQGKRLFALGMVAMYAGVLFRQVLPPDMYTYLVTGGTAVNSLGMTCFTLAAVIRMRRKVLK